MEISKKLFVTIVVGALLIGTTWTQGLSILLGSPHQPQRVNANVYVTIQDGFGVRQIPVENGITNIGERWVRDRLCLDNSTAENVSTNDLAYISLSNDDATGDVSAWTKLTSEVTAAQGFDRQTSTPVAWENGTDYAANMSITFTANTSSTQLRAAGLHWNATDDSDNNLFAAAGFTQTTFQVNDNLTITWVITFDGS